jgi:acyl-CoA thioesterase-1
MRSAWSGFFVLLASLAGCGPATESTTPEAPTAPAQGPSDKEGATAASAGSETPAPAKAKGGDATPNAPGLPPPLPKGSSVLHVGDSMADALGQPLHRELTKRGIRSYLEVKEATYIPQWAGQTMQLSSHIAVRKPDLVIITLGGNETQMPDPSERVDAIKRLVQKVGDRPCLWIAAPLWPGLKHTGILDVIRDNCAPCVFVDTNQLINDLERLSDGVHPTIPERRRWAEFMIRWLLHNRDPEGARPWSFKASLAAPPAGSEAWLEQR